METEGYRPNLPLYQLEPGEAEAEFREARKIFFELTDCELNGYLRYENRWREVCSQNWRVQCYRRIDYNYGECNEVLVPTVRSIPVAAVGFSTAAHYQILASHEDPLSVILGSSFDRYLAQAYHEPRVHKKADAAYKRASTLFEQMTGRPFGPCWPRYRDWCNLYDGSYGPANLLRGLEAWTLSQDSYETYPLAEFLDYSKTAGMTFWRDAGREFFSQAMAFMQAMKLKPPTQPTLEIQSEVQKFASKHGVDKAMVIFRAYVWNSLSWLRYESETKDVLKVFFVPKVRRRAENLVKRGKTNE